MQRNDAGYTLLELIVAIAAMALMAVPMALSLTFGATTWLDLHEGAERAERRALMQARLRDWIGAAHLFDANRRLDVRMHPLVGTQDALRFSAPVNPDPNLDTLYRVDIRLDEGKLWAEILLDFEAYDSGQETHKTILLEGVQTVSFSYLNAFLDPASPRWENMWNQPYHLPAAISMTLTFTDQQAWPELIVPLDVEEWAHCAFDEVSRTCRTGANAG